jgi:hypothetical protein
MSMAATSSSGTDEKHDLVSEIEENLTSSSRVGSSSSSSGSNQKNRSTDWEDDGLLSQAVLDVALMRGVDPRHTATSNSSNCNSTIASSSSTDSFYEAADLTEQLDSHFEFFIDSLESSQNLIDSAANEHEDGFEGFSPSERLASTKLPRSAFEPLSEAIRQSHPQLHHSINLHTFVSGESSTTKGGSGGSLSSKKESSKEKKRARHEKKITKSLRRSEAAAAAPGGGVVDLTMSPSSSTNSIAAVDSQGSSVKKLPYKEVKQYL